MGSLSKTAPQAFKSQSRYPFFLTLILRNLEVSCLTETRSAQVEVGCVTLPFSGNIKLYNGFNPPFINSMQRDLNNILLIIHVPLAIIFI